MKQALLRVIKSLCLFFLSVNLFSQDPKAPCGEGLIYIGLDADKDGYFITKCLPPNTFQRYLDMGWTALETDMLDLIDCDDNDADVWRRVPLFYDKDGDGYHGTQVNLCIGINPPEGYSTVRNDCDDEDPTKWRRLTLYFDSDGDGLFETPITDCFGEIPPGYSGKKSKCIKRTLFYDFDGDGYYGTPKTDCFIGIPPGYSPINNDCDDFDPYKWVLMTLYYDKDGDGFYGTEVTDCFGKIPPGYSPINNDCHDNDRLKWKYRTLYKDLDGDGYAGTLVTECLGDDIPPGYSETNDDCDDTDPDKWVTMTLYLDRDGDGFFGTAVTDCFGKIPPGYSETNDDCDDGNNNVWRMENVYKDNDGDGWTVGAAKSECVGFSPPEGYTFTQKGEDCDDDDENSTIELEYVIDNDGDGWHQAGSEEMLCPSFVPQLESYILKSSSLGEDCNDNNPATFPIKWFKPCNCYGPECAEGGRDRLSCEDLSLLGFTTINNGPCTPKGKQSSVSLAESITFHVTPNPATSFINITPHNAIPGRFDVLISDQYGRVLKSFKFQEIIKNQSMTIRTGDLASGFYYVTIKHGQSIVSKKIAIKM